MSGTAQPLAQLALARPWPGKLDRADPGNHTRMRRLQENLRAAAVELTSRRTGEIGRVAAEVSIVGDRYPAELEQKTNR